VLKALWVLQFNSELPIIRESKPVASS